ncbi:hypothetical protein CALCODRAFT_524477 [Calocera cornea HHB12733]|uniref:Endosomal/vacuolar adapter protein YPT35 n=1 Tax=Calocera cornea HHB12733 TaxID=1353952 RepID=A0A165EYI1_9BASI|nr:hypothetical protein CALCODRAFT_524477 [Calocera cornea HHB12733]
MAHNFDNSVSLPSPIPEESSTPGSPVSPAITITVDHPFANAHGLLQLDRRIDVEEEDQFWEDFPSEDEFFDPQLPSSNRSTRSRSTVASLHLADNSQEDTGSFTRNISIPGWSFVGDKVGAAYVVFDCAIQTKEGTTIHVLKRYSAFLHLQQELEKAVPVSSDASSDSLDVSLTCSQNLRAVLPAFPPKNTFAKYRPAFLEKRRRRLQSWLAAVLLHPTLGGLPQVRKWVIE